MKVLKKLLISIAATAAFAGTSQAMERPFNYYHQFPDAEKKALFILNNKIDQATSDLLDAKLKDAKSIEVKDLPQAARKLLAVYDAGLETTLVLKEENLVAKHENLTRIVGAHVINTCAQAHKLSVKAPIKKHYNYKKVTDWVIAPLIKPLDRPFSLLQIKDLYKLSKLTGYADMHAANIFNTEDGTVIIDTEEHAFTSGNIKRYHIKNFQDKICSLAMEPEARVWLNTKIAKLATKQTEEDIFDAIAVLDTTITLLDTCAVS
jgi:hypothetical protein